jgi:hypothetical protein
MVISTTWSRHRRLCTSRSAPSSPECQTESELDGVALWIIWNIWNTEQIRDMSSFSRWWHKASHIPEISEDSQR